MDNKVPTININFPWSSKHWRGCRKIELNSFCVLNVIWGRQKQLNVFILKFPLSSSNNCRRVSLLDRWRRITNEFSFQKFFKDFYFTGVHLSKMPKVKRKCFQMRPTLKQTKKQIKSITDLSLKRVYSKKTKKKLCYF